MRQPHAAQKTINLFPCGCGCGMRLKYEPGFTQSCRIFASNHPYLFDVSDQLTFFAPVFNNKIAENYPSEEHVAKKSNLSDQFWAPKWIFFVKLFFEAMFSRRSTKR